MRALCLLLLLLSSSAWAKTEVTVTKSDNVFHVNAQVLTAASPETALDVLTDYEHIAAFVPDMASSHIISAQGEPLQVEQKGKASFIFFSFPIEIVFEIDAKSLQGLRFHSVSGNLRDMTGDYRVMATGNGTKILYEAQFTPDFWVPPLISSSIVRNQIRRQFEGLVKEMERRPATPQKTPPS